MTILVKETELAINKILQEGDGARFQDLVAAKVLLEDQISMCKALAETVESTIERKEYASVVKEMQDAGVLSEAEEQIPPIEIQTKFGNTIRVCTSSGTETKFDLSALKEKPVLDGLPDKYKKLTVSLDSKAIAAAYDAGTLEDVFRGCVSKTTRPILKLRKTIKKKESVPDEIS